MDYIAPGDAADTHLADQCIDFHTSISVFEHIPLDALEQILREGNRITRNNGLFAHWIDYSDHFSHTDSTLSAINFLQYPDREWLRYAGNQYMYMNRLRHDDFLSLFKSAGHRLMEVVSMTDSRIPKLLENEDLHLDEQFGTKPVDVLAITKAWIISQQAS